MSRPVLLRLPPQHRARPCKTFQSQLNAGTLIIFELSSRELPHRGNLESNCTFSRSISIRGQCIRVGVDTRKVRFALKLMT